MREADLRNVLLVRAIEESDRGGTMLSIADRADATREAARAAGGAAPATDTPASPAQAQRLMALRARLLLERLVARYPFVATVVTLARGPAWLGGLVIAAALALGGVLSAIDATHRINVLAFPLLGLLAWNLVVYATVLAGWVRAARRRKRHSPWLSRLLAHAAVSRIQRVVGKSEAFHAPLAAALKRFLADWYDAARPLLLARATRLFHLGAAAVGIGLIAGLYLRGIALDYRAGWESTFLDAAQVRHVLRVAYGPAAAVTGISIPDVTHIASMRHPRA